MAAGLTTLVATLCNLMPGPQLCVEEVVAEVPYQVCKIQAQMVIAPWMASGKYRDNWELDGWKCEDDQYVVKGRI
jgi:hypothetical protein